MLALLLPALPVGVSAAGFPDVQPGDWFYENVQTLAQYGLINGKEDGLFHPNDTIKRGEFIKLITLAGELLIFPKQGTHWSEEYWNALNEAGVLEVVETIDDKNTQKSYPLIQLKSAELEKPISRYEMAYLLNRVVYLVYYLNPMTLASSSDSFAKHIADYDTMNKAYQGSVEQVYMKGILTGYADGSFQGDKSLTRAEATTVILRLLFPESREKQGWAVEKEREVDPTFTSFAFKYRNMTAADRRLALFGNASKTYFSSPTDAGGHIVTVSVKTWDIDKNGAKITRTWGLQVNTLVAREVQAIFEEIYNSPERFPIHALGGARYSDTLRHSWGCAIDINPNENYYVNYKTGQQVGSFCYKTSSSPYCITPDGSVVKAFAKYGWGWGGQGWSTAVDYMHFSILASGG